MLSKRDESVAAQAGQGQPQDLSSPLQVQLLGEPHWYCGTNPPQRLAFKDAALLAVLALDGPQPKDKLVALLWPNVSLSTANGSLRQRIFRLRHAAGREFVCSDQLVRIAPSVSIDILHLASEPEHLIKGIHKDLLAGLDATDSEPLGEWLRSARERWRIRRRDVLMGHVAHLEQRGMLARAIVLIQHLLIDEPLLEHGWRCLMRLHYLRGDRAAALATYDRLERILQDDLVALPDLETRQLLCTIERADDSPSRPVILPVTLLRPPKLIGRNSQRVAMHHAMACRMAFWLEGVAGIGKTRLMESLLDASTILVRAYPDDQIRRCSTLTRLLVDLVDGPAAVRNDVESARRKRVIRVLPVNTDESARTMEPMPGDLTGCLIAIQAALRIASQSGLRTVLIDDFHHADRCSREVIYRLMGDPSGLVSWGVATRVSMGDDSLHLLKHSLTAAGRLIPVNLDDFSRSESHEFLATLDLPGIDRHDLKEHLINYTGGNPWLMMEMLKSWGAGELGSWGAGELGSWGAGELGRSSVI